MNILVLDDDRLFRESIRAWLGSEYTTHLAATYTEAVNILENVDVDAAIIDIELGDPKHNGIDFLSHFKRKFPRKPALIQSSRKEVETIVKCIRLGADDYLEKPPDRETLQIRIQKVIADSNRTSVLERVFEKSVKSHEIIGGHPKILEAKELVEKALEARILFYGETGVGKTPFAYYSNQVVNESTGQKRPFEQLNCASLTRERFEDQLFGHKKGAFTGAVSDKKGLVEMAFGGDLFLDEIGELTLETQALFLTFLDSMEYYRMGDDQKRRARVRVICATNRDLKKMVSEGTFRQDLYSRISQKVVAIPALRDRVSDIRILLHHFVNKFAGYPKPFDEKVAGLFEKYSWEEGNVRELRDAVENACTASRSDHKIELTHVDSKYRPLSEEALNIKARENLLLNDTKAIFSVGLDDYVGHMEREILIHCIRENKDTVEGLARSLKMLPAKFYRRLKKYGLPGVNPEM